MTRMRGPAAVRQAFDTARLEQRAALIAYLMAGYPDEAMSVEAAAAALDSGADLLEVGVPFSDPVADGPVIAEAGRAALAAGGGLDGAIRVIAVLRDRGIAVPILAMSYLNPLLVRGERTPLAALADVGADGLIVPDLPAGEEPEFERLVADAGLAICFLVAPNTSPARLQRAVEASTGFVYVVPLYGVTGARDGLADGAVPLLRRVREASAGRVPVAAGFGISTPEQVAELAPIVDGVVVGSALLTALRREGPEGVAELSRSLSASTRSVPLTG